MSKKHKAKKSPPKQTTPHFLETHWQTIIIIFLLILPIIYFAQFLNANQMIGGSDFLIGGYPYEKWTAEQEGMPLLNPPLWQPYVVGGIPELGAPFGGPLRPSTQLREIIPPHVVLALFFIIIFFLAGLGVYFYLKEIGLSEYTAAVGAVIYQFIGSLATTPAAGHAGRAASIALFPLMLFFIHRGLSTKKLLYFTLFALITAFAFYESHFQITYYGLLFIFGYVIYYLVTHRREISKRDIVKIFGYGLGSIALIFLLMAAVWLPAYGGLETAARGVERGYEYATSWALPPHELIDLFIPTYSGILENYWGMNPFKLHLEYFGIVTLIFAILTLIFFWKTTYVRYYTLKIFVVLLVALGSATPIFRIFYTIIPGFSRFRAPSLVFYLISFSFIVLGAIGFENILVKGIEEKQIKLFRKRFSIVAGIILAIFVITGLVCIVSRDSIIQSMQESFRAVIDPQKLAAIENNFSHFIQGIWRSVAFIAIICGIIFLSIKKKIRPFIFAIGIIAICLIDQLPLMAKFLPKAPKPEVYYRADDVTNFLKNDKSVFRVFPFQYEHARDLFLLYHNIQSAGGYMPNPIQRYQDFIGAGKSVMFNPLNLIQYPQFTAMLNIKYVIAPNLPDDISRYDMQTQEFIREMKKYLSNFEQVFVGRTYSVYLNQRTLPRAYVVPNYQVATESDVLNILKSPEFDPRQTVLLEQNPGAPHPEEKLNFVAAYIKEYSANKIICTTACTFPGFLVLTDNWHPDWQVFVDGKKSTLYQANYTFRAVYIPAGEHEIVFMYNSPYFNTGKIITLIALVFSIGLCFIAVKFKI